MKSKMSVAYQNYVDSMNHQLQQLYALSEAARSKGLDPSLKTECVIANDIADLVEGLVGPTAVGKTALGIQLAKHYATEIISADSRQIYREMNIGTAVPSKKELAEVKHHFIQTKSVFDYYNASMYEVDALQLIDELFLTRDMLVVVGGSTLYIDTLCYGIDDLPTVDPEIREQVINQYKAGGIEYLQEQVKLLDPEHYGKVDIQNPKRLMKAIEV